MILDAELSIVGKPWRGNLRTAINEATDSADWIKRLFALCNAEGHASARITMAIDTPLGFSDEFVRLVTQRQPAGEMGRSATNPYLFRQTERFLFEHGLTPLSAIKDMIGSQATKGMHVLAKFAPQTCVVASGRMASGSPPSKPIRPPARLLRRLKACSSPSASSPTTTSTMR